MIDIYEFENPIPFLKAFLSDKKSRNTDYTISKFSRDLGFNSPQVFTDILKEKKPLKTKYVSNILTGLQLDPSEERYFTTMTYLNNAKAKELKDSFSHLLTLLNPGPREELRIQDEDLFSNWINIAILTLSKTQNFKLNEDYICSIFRHKISKDEVKKSLNFLIKNKYIEISSSNIEKCSNTVSSKTDKPIESVLRYYSDVSDLAKEGAKLPVDIREFQCFSMAIKKENVVQAKQLIRDFRKKLANLCESEAADEVYQTNIQFFPLTKITE